jgi:hypothetical protein
MRVDVEKTKLASRLRKEAVAGAKLDDRQALEARLAALKEIVQKPDLRFTRYTHGGGILESRCKVTGEWLTGLTEVDGHERTQKLANGQTIIYKRVATMYSSRCTHLIIIFDDGSKHQTLASVDVIKQLKALPEAEQMALLEYIYMSDIEQWKDEEARGMGRLNARMLAHREPVAWEEGGM